jgi:hypothetical protein
MIEEPINEQHKGTQEEFDQLMRLYTSIEPYQYMVLNNKVSEIGLAQGAYKDQDKELIGHFHEVVDLAFASDGMRIINVDDDFVPLLEDTKPRFNAPGLHLRYNPMFINKRFEIGDNIVMGVLLIEGDDGKIIFCAINGNKTALGERKLISGLDESGHMVFNITEWGIGKEIIRFASNLVNMMNLERPSISETEVKVLPGQNDKRAKRGKQPMRDTLTLRLTGKLGRYARIYRQERARCSHSFLVGGFYREYRSPRYSAGVRFDIRWINPFRKNMDLPDDLKKFVQVKRGTDEA